MVSAILNSVSGHALEQAENLSKRMYKPGDRIAVIGAGVSGLAVVRQLVESGVAPSKITVFEKAPRAGGKVETVSVDGKPYELGAAVIIPGRYVLIQDLAYKYGLTYRPLGKGGNYNVTTGQFETMSGWKMTRLLGQITKYITLYQLKFKDFLGAKGYANIPEELRMSWPEFIRQNGLELFNEGMGSVIGGSGYLRAADPPEAAQIARLLRPSSVLSLITNGPHAFNEGGFQKLWELEALECANQGVSFRFEDGVKSLERRKIDTLITHDKGQTAFEHVFYSADLSYLPKLLADTTDAERELYGRIQFYDYRSYILRIQGLPDAKTTGTSGFAPYSTDGIADHPVVMVKSYADTDVYVVYAYGSEGVSDDTIIANMKNDFTKLGGQVTEVLHAKKWRYFPHVKKDLQGFFRGVMSQQGSGGVWITGEATSFALTTEVYEQGRDFAKLFVENEL